LVRFDYLALQTVNIGQSSSAPGAALPVDVVWLPQPSDYRDTYLARWQLRDHRGAVQQQWELPLGSWAYPSGVWPAGIPVRQPLALPLAPTTPPGDYALTLQVIRNGDGTPLTPLIPWQQRWWGSQTITQSGETVRLADVRVE
jgi:hypothetical protein